MSVMCHVVCYVLCSGAVRRRRHSSHQRLTQTHDHRARRPHKLHNHTRTATTTQEKPFPTRHPKREKTNTVAVQGMSVEILPTHHLQKRIPCRVPTLHQRCVCKHHEPQTGVDVTERPTEKTCSNSSTQ